MDRTQPSADLLFDAVVISAPMGLDEHTIRSLLESLADQALRNDGKREDLLEGTPDEQRAMILAGIQRWRDRVVELADRFIGEDRPRVERVRQGLQQTTSRAVWKAHTERLRRGYGRED